MEIWHAVLLGLVEGITEYLPVSSTGHLIITAALLGLDEPPEIKRAVDAFSVVIQGGGILAVLGLYRKRVARMILGLMGRDTGGRRLALNLLVAFLPAAIVGLLLDTLIDLEDLLFRPAPVLAALALGGVFMILLGRWQRRFFHDARGDEVADARSYVDIEHLSWRRALLIGVAQCVAIWPGTSRSMTTIVGGMMAGLRPRDAAEFSFLLGLPTLGAACLYRGAQNVLGDGPNMLDMLGAAPLVVGLLVATISAALAIRWLVAYLSHHGVALFGWYRLALCAALLTLSLTGIVTIQK